METNTDAINIVTGHCEHEALHRMVYRAKGAAISVLLGLLRRPAPRNDTFLIAVVLIFRLWDDDSFYVIICACFCQFKPLGHFVVANRERIKKLTIFKRVGVPQDIIGIAIFLASEESAYMTGQTVVVDGVVV